MIGTMPPIVVDMQRRFRLEGRGTVEVPVRLDLADFGVLLNNNPFQMIDFNVTAILDPRPRPDGSVSRGMLGAQGSEDFLQYWGEPLTMDNVDAWLKQAITTNPVQRLVALARLEIGLVYLYDRLKNDKGLLERISKAQAGEEVDREAEEDEDSAILALEMTPEHIDAFKEKIGHVERRIELTGDTINARFPTMNRVEQTWVLLFLPRTKETVELFAPIYDRVERSHDPLLRITYMAVHVRSQQSTLITDALRELDPQIIAYAEAVQKHFVAAAALQGSK